MENTNRPAWFNTLHEQALQKMYGGRWMRLREFTDNPVIARDLLGIKEIECKSIPGKNKRNTVTLYRAVNYFKG